MGDIGAKIALLPVLMPAFLVAVTLHELAHGWVANKLGDATAKDDGRLTLNPIKHLDPVGSTMLLVTFFISPIMFGWAKPIPVNTRNLKNPKRDMAIVAVAGPITNFVLAWAVVFWCLNIGDASLLATNDTYASQAVNYFIYLNVVLSAFNLFPIPPLDGSRIVGAFMPKDMHEAWSSLDQYAILFFLVIFISPIRGPFQTLLFSIVEWMYSLLATLSGA